MHVNDSVSAGDTGTSAANATGAPDAAGFGEVLRNRQFLSLWSGQVLSQLADKVFYVLMVVLVTTGTTAHTSVSLLTIIYTLPAVFFGSVAGIFVDRWDKRAILIGSNIGRAICLVFMPSGGPYLIVGVYIAAFSVSTIMQFFAPAEMALLPAIVERRLLLPANSLFTTTMITSIIVGFAVGDPLLSLFGTRYGHWVVAAMYLLSAACIMFVRKTPTPPPQQSHFIAEFREGIRYIWRHKPTMNAMMRLVILFSAFAAITVLVIGFVRDALELPERYFGYILAFSGVGMAVGAGIVGRFGALWNRDKVVFIGFLVMGWQLVGLSHANSLVVTMILAGTTGVGAAFVAVPLQALLQETVPESLRGKVFGVQNMLINLASTIPMAMAGVLGDALGVRWVVYLTGILVLIGSLLGSEGHEAGEQPGVERFPHSHMH
ncbi:MAG: MFS transporter [Candidatus Sericytochromatia bacterium]|nr:MFS transporter [Candidatus Sericytochromatia bacterium]